MDHLPNNPPTYLNVIFTYQPIHIPKCNTYLSHPPTYSHTPYLPTYLPSLCITYLLITYLPTHTPIYIHIHVLCTYIRTHLLIYLFIHHLFTYPPTHLSFTTYLPSNFIILQWVEINMWNKKIDKCFTPFNGVVHWIRTWFIIGEVKGSIPNSYNLCTRLRG
jgi:hypothetical protein